jgi:S1-C subfamily serine protease
MKLKQFFLIVAVSSISALASVWAYSKFIEKNQTIAIQSDGKVPANYTGFINGQTNTVDNDFIQASQTSVQAVVHIKTKIPAQKVSNELPKRQRGVFDDFFDRMFEFGPQIIPEQRASGSGVLISGDGYIVTNNHVISDRMVV